ncbi:MAG: hypothetical protein AAGI23_00710 [Bacteroidota bacterium]
MKLIFSYMVLLMIGQVTYAQQGDKIQLSFAIEPYLGYSQIESEIGSNDYFRRYTPTYESTYLFGIDGDLTFPSCISVTSGLRYMSFWAGTDYLNISPIGIKEVYSQFSLRYHAITVPVKAGYSIAIKNIVEIKPEVGLILRFLGGQQYEEETFQEYIIPLSPKYPSILTDYDRFRLGLEGGLSIYLFPSKRLQPVLSAQYFTSYSVFEYYASLNPNRNNYDRFVQRGNITDEGLFYTFGVRYQLGK